MRFCRSVLFIGSLICSVPLIANDASTFSDVLRMARENSLELRRAEGAKQLAEHDAMAQEKKYDPKLTTGVSGALKYVATPAPTNASSRPGLSPLAQQPGNFEVQYSLQGSATVWDFGRSAAEEQRLQAVVNEKASLLKEQEEALAYRVARVFLKVLSARELAGLASQQIENATRKYGQVKDNYGRGLRPEYDLVRAEVDLGRARLASRKSGDEFDVAVLQLRQLMFSANSNSDAPDSGVKNLRGSLSKSVTTWSVLSGRLAQNRSPSSLETRRLQRAGNALEQDAINARLMPSLGASAGAAWSRGTYLPETKDSGTKTTLSGALNLSWDIPWNGAYKDESFRVVLRDRDLALAEEQELRSRAERGGVAAARVKALLGQVDLAEKQVALSSRNLGIVRQKYDAGKASATELSVAEDEALNARVEVIRSQSAIAEGLVDLAEINGADVAAVESIFAKE